MTKNKLTPPPTTTTSLFAGSDVPVKKQFRISQSFMKEMRAFINGAGCGILIKERWIHGSLIGKASAAMELGCYFEYILTGSIPKDGIVPQPKYMASKVKANKGSTTGLTIDDMFEPYRSAHENKQRVEDYLTVMGLRIYAPLNTGPASGVHIVKGRFEGVLDVILEAVRDIRFDSGYEIKKGQLITTDIKYSGLLEDKWSEHGWQWTDIQKQYHGTQAKQYKFLSGHEVFFLVVDPGGKYVKFFHTVIDEDGIQRHIEEGNALYDKLVYLDEMDLLEPRPEVNKCAVCPLLAVCNHRHIFPHAIEIDLK